MLLYHDSWKFQTSTNVRCLPSIRAIRTPFAQTHKEATRAPVLQGQLVME